MTKRNDDAFEKIFELVDNMFGSIEELPADDVARFLADADANTDGVKRRLYERASALRGEHWARNVNPPAHLEDFLAQLRPTDLPSSDPKTIATAARKLVDRLLNRPLAPQAQIAFAYRDKKGELTEQDAALLEELAKRLKTDAAHKNK